MFSGSFHLSHPKSFSLFADPKKRAELDPIPTRLARVFFRRRGRGLGGGELREAAARGRLALGAGLVAGLLRQGLHGGPGHRGALNSQFARRRKRDGRREEIETKTDVQFETRVSVILLV